MYQALYRKWRPQTFSEMVGQEAIVRTLRNQVASGRVSHAYLFCGSRGTGKTSAAKIMARAVNCEHPVDGDPCLECRNCKTLAEDASLDVVEMDAASNSRVEEIRELLESVYYPPQSGKKKVFIIDEVHMLSNSAFNALLKTLEEPPEYMLFILATTEPQKLPATILSRCQRFDFGRFTEEQMISRLRMASGDADCDEEALALIARAAEGSMRDAWSLLDMCVGAGRVTEARVREMLGSADRGFLFEYAAALAAGDSALALRLTDRLMRDGRDAQVFSRDFAAHLRQLIAAKLDAGAGMESKENIERLRAQAEEFSLPRLLRTLSECMRAESDMRLAPSARTVLELFALRACQAPLEETAALVERVAELEREVAALREGGVAVAPKAPVVHKTPAKAPESAPEEEPEESTPEDAAPVRRTPKDVWNAMLKRLAKQSPSCYGMVKEGKFGGYQDGKFTLNFPEDSFYIGALNDEKRRGQVEALLAEEYGEIVRFEAKSVAARDPEAEKRVESDTDSLIGMFGRSAVQIDD